MAFHLGSLGFLTSFRFRDFREKITDVLTGKFNPCNKNFKIYMSIETIEKLMNPCLPAIVSVLPSFLCLKPLGILKLARFVDQHYDGALQHIHL